MENFTKIEKKLIARSDNSYVLYRCHIHGMFELHRDYNTGMCPWCLNKSIPIPDVDALRERFRSEIRFTPKLVDHEI